MYIHWPLKCFRLLSHVGSTASGRNCLFLVDVHFCSWYVTDVIQPCVSQGQPSIPCNNISCWGFLCAPSVVWGIVLHGGLSALCMSVTLAFGVLRAVSLLLRAPLRVSSKRMLCIASRLQSWSALPLSPRLLSVFVCQLGQGSSRTL